MTSANDLGERKKVRARLAEDKVAIATIFRPPSLPSPKLRSLFSRRERVFGRESSVSPGGLDQTPGR